jgi:hypothetical protein
MENHQNREREGNLGCEERTRSRGEKQGPGKERKSLVCGEWGEDSVLAVLPLRVLSS